MNGKCRITRGTNSFMAGKSFMHERKTQPPSDTQRERYMQGQNRTKKKKTTAWNEKSGETRAK